jgi:hypothetical protein
VKKTKFERFQINGSYISCNKDDDCYLTFLSSEGKGYEELTKYFSSYFKKLFRCNNNFCETIESISQSLKKRSISSTTTISITSTTTSTTTTIKDRITVESECLSAYFSLYSGSYDKNTKNLMLIVENKRSINLQLENLFLMYPDRTETKILNTTLGSNMLKLLNITDVNDNFNSGTIKTNCHDVSVDFTHSQVT